VCKQSYTRHVQYVKLLITLLLKYCLLCFRSTPIEVLHTVLLGPYKYLTGKVMAKLNTMEKHEVLARIASINHSGIKERISSNVTRYSQSFVGRDFKAWAQMAPFILLPYLTTDELKLWLSLSQVCMYTYTLHA